jgi:L-fuconolactonase
MTPSFGHSAFNRRRFLATTVGTFAGFTFTGCSSSIRAAGPLPDTDSNDFRLIDTHTHFYDPTRPQGVPWPPPEDKLLYRRVLPRDYRILPVPRPMTGTVVVEASPWLDDNQWVLDLAAKEPFIVGFVGNLPVGTKDFASHLNRFAANKIFRGIRLGEGKLDNGLDDSSFMNDLKLLADRDLSLDLLGGEKILRYAERLSEVLPNLRIIIDHLAGLNVDGKAPPPEWVKQMRTAARRRGIYCKLSGLVEGTSRSDGTAPRDVKFYTPVLDAMREIFGPERLIYASNWPVSERFAPLATVQGIVADYFRSHGRQEEEQVFSKSAKNAYRLGTKAKLKSR